MKKSKLKTKNKVRGHANRRKERRQNNLPQAVKTGSIYWPDHIDEVAAIAGRGLTDEEMAIFLGVTPELYESWQAYYPRFADAIEQGRTKADVQVVAALFKNAVGYDYESDVVVRGRKGAMVLKATVHVPAETNAQKFWLTNRAPARWNNGQTVSHTSPKGSPVLVKQETKQEVIHSILNMIEPQPDGEGER